MVVLLRRDETGDFVLDVLKKHMEQASNKCSVSDWISSLNSEEQTVFENIRVISETVNVASLYKDLKSTENLPFKLTAFRSHIRGYCTCPKS